MKPIKDILPDVKPSDVMPVKDIETVNPLIPFQYKDAEVEKSIKLDYNKSWYLSGEPGVGKTHLAYALKRKALPKIERGYVFGVKNLIDFISKLKSFPFEERDFYIYSLKTFYNYLIIDDLGAEQDTGYNQDIVYQIIDYRLNNGLITCFTSNHKVGELHYNDRIKSRILGIVGSNKFELKGTDRRLK